MNETEAEAIKRAVRDGMIDGAKTLAKDSDFVKAFWESGYEQLSSHAGKGASRWVGSRMLTAAAIAILSAIVGWLVRSGRI